MFKVFRGVSSSDKDLTGSNKSRLHQSLASNAPSEIVPLKGVNYGPIAQVEFAASRIAPEYYYHSVPPVNFFSQTEDLSQDRTIAALKQQLAAVSSSASIGMSQLSGSWNTDSSSSSNYGGGSSKAAQIKALEAQLADARRYAAIGDARLNKWRSRTFSS
jgi:phycoerythrin-associated linker protein